MQGPARMAKPKLEFLLVISSRKFGQLCNKRCQMEWPIVLNSIYIKGVGDRVCLNFMGGTNVRLSGK